MEKLLELLNKYSKEKHNLAMRELNGELGQGFHYLSSGSSYSELLMISKKYEFIKRLVENNKIDGRELRGKAREISEACLRVYQWREYESLLMILAISNEPIELLNSLLK